MSQHPFAVPFRKLPKTLPVFPLPGAVLMPGNDLPLNIFEPRYLNMVNDALGSHRMIGMIQPDPQSDDPDALTQTGCAGRITQYRETRDGRIEMVLSGVCRFDRGEEVATTRGYRLIVPDWHRFEADYEEEKTTPGQQTEMLRQTVKRYLDVNKLDVDWPLLERLSAVRLTNSLSMALPLSPPAKQQLLETIDPDERITAFIACLDSSPGMPGSGTRH
jgi:Lon protease-like protein